ncbi:MAG: DUF2795 domain-containing protein [Deltaproteobacteria bacterium]|nr:DUF2795 domain-containing protein [Deltaproteobacteria bacterium]
MKRLTTKTFAATMAFAAAAGLSAPTFALAKPASADKSAARASDSDEQKLLKEHIRLRDHITKRVKYPASKQEVVSACKGKREIKASDAKWVEETLPDRTYNSPVDVEEALGWETTTKAEK